MSSIRQRANELYQQHLHLRDSNYTLFRRTIMDQLQTEFDVSVASAATHFNTARQQAQPAPAVSGHRRIRQARGSRPDRSLKPDGECYSVMELVDDESGTFIVGRYRSFLDLESAQLHYQQRFTAWPAAVWVLVQGLGPNSGDPYRLDAGERELQRYPTL